MKSNPFATRFVAPGCLPWLEDQVSLDELTARFAQQARRSAIVGPHGSGKSTLVSHLLEHTAPSSLVLQLRKCDCPAQKIRRAFEQWRRCGLLVLDGLEQLLPWQRWAIVARARLSGLGLLVTSHCRVPGLPTLFTTHVDVSLAQSIVVHALKSEVRTTANSPLASLTQRQLLSRLLTKHRGNMREVLMDLYDFYETQTICETQTSECGALLAMSAGRIRA